MSSGWLRVGDIPDPWPPLQKNDIYIYNYRVKLIIKIPSFNKKRLIIQIEEQKLYDKYISYNVSTFVKKKKNQRFNKLHLISMIKALV